MYYLTGFFFHSLFLNFFILISIIKNDTHHTRYFKYIYTLNNFIELNIMRNIVV